MYARKKGIVADVHRLNGLEVVVILKSGNKRKWKGGNGDIELIEFGSFNPENDNYREGGKVLRRI